MKHFIEQFILSHTDLSDVKYSNNIEYEKEFSINFNYILEDLYEQFLIVKKLEDNRELRAMWMYAIIEAFKDLDILVSYRQKVKISEERIQ